LWLRPLELGEAANGVARSADETPQVLPQVISYKLYRWEYNIRAAAIRGVVGAGGLGQLLAFHMGLFQMGKTATVLCAMLVMVALVDAVSYAMRRVLSR